jgi:hypothetical protein
MRNLQPKNKVIINKPNLPAGGSWPGGVWVVPNADFNATTAAVFSGPYSSPAGNGTVDVTISCVGDEYGSTERYPHHPIPFEKLPIIPGQSRAAAKVMINNLNIFENGSALPGKKQTPGQQIRILILNESFIMSFFLMIFLLFMISIIGSVIVCIF